MMRPRKKDIILDIEEECNIAWDEEEYEAIKHGTYEDEEGYY